jgi:GAF domain-containing protein
MTRQNLTLDDMAQTMAISAEHGPQAVFAAIDRLAQRTIGHVLFTLMRLYEDKAEVERVYSDNPKAYPVGGRKQKQGTEWGKIVLDRGEVFIAPDEAAVKAAFADHALIHSLGIGSIMNVPINAGGRRLGTMNISNKAHWFTEADVKTGKLLGGLLVPAYLALK